MCAVFWPLRIGMDWICLAPAMAQKRESSTLLLPLPFRPVISTRSPVGVISTARSFFTFSQLSLITFMPSSQTRRGIASRQVDMLGGQRPDLRNSRGNTDGDAVGSERARFRGAY